MIAAVLASGNPHKLGELRAVLGDWQIEPLAVEGPDETGATYHENALLKARFGRELVDPALWVLAEDSGIECAALGGEPGLHSARWAAGRDAVEALLERLEGTADRSARMVSELVGVAPGGAELAGSGVLEGSIALEPRGSSGFGYDPVFVPRGSEQTVAELGEEWKTGHSHRAQAALALDASLGAPARGGGRGGARRCRR